MEVAPVGLAVFWSDELMNPWTGAVSSSDWMILLKASVYCVDCCSSGVGLALRPKLVMLSMAWYTTGSAIAVAMRELDV